MAHFFLVPTNDNGIVTDQYIVEDLGVALNAPMGFSDVFIYSHGWWTGPDRAMQDYNRFTIEFARAMRLIAERGSSKSVPTSSLGIGIHWPSMLSQDTNAIINWLQATSYYTMEKRADNVGQNAGYLLLRCLFQGSVKPDRVVVVGHSFGCKVVLSMLQEIFDDKSTVSVPKDIALSVILLQAACGDNDLEKDDVYGDVAAGFPKMRLLVTTSQEDKALNVAYPAAQMVNVFRGKKSRIALGGGGPTAKVIKQFGGAQHVDVPPDFERRRIVELKSARLVVADLTPVHRDPANPYKADTFSGHHSDIFIPQLYELMVGFIYGV